MPAVNFTDAFVNGAKCKPGGAMREFRDTGVHGLELRVTAGGAKSWRLHYTRRSDGRRRVVGLGSYPMMSLKKARAKARTLKGQIEDEDTRADPAARKQERRRGATFAEIAGEWLSRHGKPNKSRRALRDDQSMLDRHILPQIGAMRAAEIAKRDIIGLLDEVATKPDARKARVQGSRMTHRPNRVFELVRSIFRWAVGRDLLQVDPTWGLSAPIKKETPRERELSPTEIRQFWQALDRAPVQRRSTKGLTRGERAVSDEDVPMTRAIALALKLSLVTAQRIGEVAGIAQSELDLNEAAPVWTVPRQRAKNGQANRVPLSPLAVRLIKEAQELAGAGAWLFPSPKNAWPANSAQRVAAVRGATAPIDPHVPSKALSRARAAIGLADFRVHDLRRTAATRMAELGISPHTISLVLNHVSARKGTITGAVYVQYSYDREKREALDAWGARLERIIAGTVAG
jgi:integrase